VQAIRLPLETFGSAGAEVLDIDIRFAHQAVEDVRVVPCFMSSSRLRLLRLL